MGNANKSLALLLVALFLASLVQLPCASVKADSSDDWVMFHHDPSHTGVTTGAGPTKPDELWSYEEGHFLGYYTGVESSPAIVNGLVYIGSNLDSNIYAFNAYTGKKSGITQQAMEYYRLQPYLMARYSLVIGTEISTLLTLQQVLKFGVIL